MKTTIRLNKEFITLSYTGEIKQMNMIIGRYTKHIPKKISGLKVVPYYYSVVLNNGKSYDVIYSRKEIKEIIHNQIMEIEYNINQ